MSPFQDYLAEYQRQMHKGAIQQAYKGLLTFLMDLRTHFNKQYPDYFVSGSIYAGYMDMSYFSLTPKTLKDRKLKVAIVFLHEAFRFEVWLGGYNKQVQQEYWELFKENAWDGYPLVSTTQGVDSIVEHILVDHPDFRDLNALTALIETGTLKFIKDIEGFLSAR